MEEEIEYETVKLRIPKAVMDLLRAFRNDVDEYLTWVIVDRVASVLSEDLSNDGEIVNLDIIEKFDLKRVFESFDCMMYMPKDC